MALHLSRDTTQPSLRTSADREWIESCARDAGFDLAGVALLPAEDSDEACQEEERFAAWVAAGHAGEMDYLKRADAAGRLLRADLRRSMPWAHSVLVCALNYNAAAPRSIDPAPEGSGWIARYAWSGRPREGTDAASMLAGSDYHDVLLPMLEQVAAALRERFGEACETRCYVDTGPMLERGLAARAGVGWIGKNTCVIHQQQGSWLLLGVIVTSLEFSTEAASVAAADRCGTCTRCIDACPTEAILTPTPEQPMRQLDASRCIAYLTIEKKGSIPEELRAPMGRQVFGCDICQDVCPWNRRAPIATSSALPARPELVNPALEWLASLDGPAFNRIFRGSPLERTRRRRVLRNVAIAMGNSSAQRYQPVLEAWAAGEDAVLAEAACWALEQLSSAREAAHCDDEGSAEESVH
jgi:epoxyqueuosine reductase